MATENGILEVTGGFVLNIQKDWALQGEALFGHAVAIAACQEFRNEDGTTDPAEIEVFSLTPGAEVFSDRRGDTFQIIIDLGTSPAVNAVAVAVTQGKVAQVLPFKLNL